ncbi:MAG: peptide deformylase [Cyanobacteria bacterium P01_A01_bin.83]
MNQLPKIAQNGEPLLRSLATPVDDVFQPEIKQLIDDLTATAIANSGVGIAAPQILQSLRLFIIASHPSERYPQAPTMPPTAMINPRILSSGTEIVKDWEGCLSVPNTRGLVPRYRSIEVEYTTPQGEIKPNYGPTFLTILATIPPLFGGLWLSPLPNLLLMLVSYGTLFAVSSSVRRALVDVLGGRLMSTLKT